MPDPLKEDRIKVETKLSKEEKERFDVACKRRGATMSAINRLLILGFCEAVESGKSPDAPFEVRGKEK